MVIADIIIFIMVFRRDLVIHLNIKNKKDVHSLYEIASFVSPQH